MTRRMRREIVSLAAMTLVLNFPIVFDGWIGADKIKHFIVTAALQSFAYSALQAAGMERGDAMRASVAGAAAAGIGREIYDGRVKRRFSIPDLMWDAGGIAAATVMLRSTR